MSGNRISLPEYAALREGAGIGAISARAQIAVAGNDRASFLQGLLTSPVYLQEAKRNILVGPFWPGEERGEQRLGPQGEVLYSSLDSLYRSPLAERFREIEQT
jgi:folate-binding Fe-S cluster repair protein YgfZ